MVIDYLLASEEEVCPSSPHNERSIAMANFLPSSVESGGCGHVIFLEKRRSALLVLRRGG